MSPINTKKFNSEKKLNNTRSKQKYEIFEAEIKKLKKR